MLPRLKTEDDMEAFCSILMSFILYVTFPFSLFRAKINFRRPGQLNSWPCHSVSQSLLISATSEHYNDHNDYNHYNYHTDYNCYNHYNYYSEYIDYSVYNVYNNYNLDLD